MKSGSHKLDLKIKLTTPWLGDKLTRGVKKFNMLHAGGVHYVKVNTAQWRWALREAMDAIGVLAESNVDYIGIPTKLKSPSVQLFTLDSQAQSGKPRKQMHECFSAGTVLTLPMFLHHELNQPGPSILPERPITPDELIQCFDIIGENIGLSPWGSKFGYGRFTVIS